MRWFQMIERDRESIVREWSIMLCKKKPSHFYEAIGNGLK